MASSIFPDPGAGGVVYRDAAGNCLNPGNVNNAFCPPVTYVANCALTALPSDCTARIEPRQINALASEMLSFAACLDPNGPWDCNGLMNICHAFQQWIVDNLVVDQVSIVGNGTHASPWKVDLVDGGTW